MLSRVIRLAYIARGFFFVHVTKKIWLDNFFMLTSAGEPAFHQELLRNQRCRFAFVLVTNIILLCLYFVFCVDPKYLGRWITNWQRFVELPFYIICVEPLCTILENKKCSVISSISYLHYFTVPTPITNSSSLEANKMLVQEIISVQPIHWIILFTVILHEWILLLTSEVAETQKCIIAWYSCANFIVANINECIQQFIWFCVMAREKLF